MAHRGFTKVLFIYDRVKSVNIETEIDKNRTEEEYEILFIKYLLENLL